METQEAVAAFLKSRQAKGLSPQTLRWYGGILAEFARQFPELPDRPEAVDTFLSSCRGGDERRHGYFRTLRAFYRFLARRYQLPNPVEMTDPPKRRAKRPRPLTPQGLSDLLSYPHSPLIHTALLFLVDTGCRVGELSSLSPEDFSETEWGIVVTVNGKTGARTVPVSPEVYRAIIQVIPFTCSPYRLRRLISRAFHDARIKGTAHTLRHTFCSLWDGPEMTLQRIAGHSHFTTTQGYRATRLQKMCQEHRQFSPLNALLRSSRSML
jgi:integrase